MRNVIFTIFSSLILFSACIENNDTKLTDESSKQPEIIPVENIHSIELIKGEKWSVVDHMLAHIRNMEKDVSTFSKSNSKEYEALASRLGNHIELLTSNCTMTGQAHDELHKWLLPFIDLVDEFSIAENQEMASGIF